MSNPADLGQSKWRLHVLTNQAVGGPGFMGTPQKNGVNTDVVLTFPSEGQLPAPETSSPVPFAVTWTKAVIVPEDEYDTEFHRGKYWARFIPAAIEDHLLIQIAQVGYPTNGAGPNTIRLFSGRLQTREPLMFFGHGAGNDNHQNLSFTFTRE